MKYIIMCGGNYTKFKEPRQLIEVEPGESLVDRTIRLLLEAGVSRGKIYISTNDSRFLGHGVSLLSHENNFTVGGYENYDKNSGWWMDCFYPTDSPACYIFGDVFFSQEAIKTIVDAEREDRLGVRFFASTHSHARTKYYFKNYAEPFAFKVWNQEYFRDCIETTKEFSRQGKYYRHPISWELWGTIAGKSPLIAYDNYDAINDYTCDVDDPEDVKKLRECVELYFKDKEAGDENESRS